MNQKTVVAKLIDHRYEGGKWLVVRGKVIEGPTNYLDRHISTRLNFDEIEKLYLFMQECKSRHEANEKRLADMNAQTQE